MKYITIKDIARHLSISVSTVSRALGDEKNIRKETKEKVIEAAKRLGYRPNPVAITRERNMPISLQYHWLGNYLTSRL